MAIIKGFTVLSPDGFPIDHDSFYPTKKAAKAARDNYPERFRQQGYYGTVRNGKRVRISLDDLPNECTIHGTAFEQVKVRFYINNQPGSGDQIIGYLPEETGSSRSMRLCFIEGDFVSVKKNWPDQSGMAFAAWDQFQNVLAELEACYDDVIVLKEDGTEITRVPQPNS